MFLGVRISLSVYPTLSGISIVSNVAIVFAIVCRNTARDETCETILWMEDCYKFLQVCHLCRKLEAINAFGSQG